jgi:y4mF family transcriptional regulator
MGLKPDRSSDIFPIGNMQIVSSPADIGILVRRGRKAAGLRQDDLAGLAGVGTRFLIELEAGKPTVRLDKLLAVLATLGIALHLDGAPE